jgi:predicted nucleic acid-binding protein
LAVVSDASPLIILSKLGRLSLLTSLYDRVLIPQGVYQEAVVAGLQKGHADAIGIDHLVHLLEAAAMKHLTLPEFELLIQEIKSRPEFWISERLCDAALERVQKL